MLIIHGENQIASRQYLTETKNLVQKKSLETVTLDGESLTLEELLLHTSQVNLLGQTVTIIVEGFFTRRPSNDKKKVIDYLEKNPHTDIVFWDGKDVSSQVKIFPPASLKKFEVTKYIFKFLDTLALNDLEKTLTTEPAELVFSLLVNHVRKIIQVLDSKVNLSLAPWQLSKLKSQAKTHPGSFWLAQYQKLLILEVKQKTSASAYDLATALEMWVMGLNSI